MDPDQDVAGICAERGGYTALVRPSISARALGQRDLSIDVGDRCGPNTGSNIPSVTKSAAIDLLYSGEECFPGGGRSGDV